MTEKWSKPKYFSEDYKLLCRFLKEVGVYKLFKEYEAERGVRRISINTENSLASLGQTQFSYWVRRNKHIRPKSNYYTVFQKWLKTFYPEYYEKCGSPEIYGFYGDIDIEKRKVIIEYEKN